MNEINKINSFIRDIKNDKLGAYSIDKGFDSFSLETQKTLFKKLDINKAYNLDNISKFAAKGKDVSGMLISLVENYSLDRNQLDEILSKRKPGEIIDLSSVNLSGCDLSGIDFTNVNLSNAYLGNTNLDGAIFDNTDLTNTNMEYTKINNATFRNLRLSGTNFKGAKIKLCKFNDVALESNVQFARVTFFRNEIFDSDFNINGDTNYGGALILDNTFSNCKFPEANWIKGGNVDDLRNGSTGTAKGWVKAIVGANKFTNGTLNQNEKNNK
jgi:uncharacterized protein YjbI with pentapeptide repeats